MNNVILSCDMQEALHSDYYQSLLRIIFSSYWQMGMNRETTDISKQVQHNSIRTIINEDR